jgi:hypothetical protein
MGKVVPQIVKGDRADQRPNGVRGLSFELRPEMLNAPWREMVWLLALPEPGGALAGEDVDAIGLACVGCRDGLMDVGIERAAERLAQALERRPTAEEIATALGHSVGWVEQVLAATRRPISLETLVGGAGEQTLGDVLPDQELPPPADCAVQLLLQRDVAVVLEHLTARLQRIIDMRYGLSDGRRRTLEEIGRLLGMTRERARQIEAEALQRLRNLEGAEHLQEYLEE